MTWQEKKIPELIQLISDNDLSLNTVEDLGVQYDSDPLNGGRILLE